MIHVYARCPFPHAEESTHVTVLNQAHVYAYTRTRRAGLLRACSCSGCEWYYTVRTVVRMGLPYPTVHVYEQRARNVSHSNTYKYIPESLGYGPITGPLGYERPRRIPINSAAQ